MKRIGESIPTIEARRIALRPLTKNDLNSLYAIYSDPQVMRYWGDTPMKNRSEAQEFLAAVTEDLHRRKGLQWGIARLGDNQAMGTLALFHWDQVAQKCEIGFALGRAYWGMGFMQEALQVAISFGFDELEIRRIEADVDPRNISAIKLLERLGFQKEGYLRERWLVPAETQDSLFYGLLRREWNPANVEYKCILSRSLGTPQLWRTSNEVRLAQSFLRHWTTVIAHRFRSLGSHSLKTLK